MKAEDLSKLSAPFPKEDIHWRVQDGRVYNGKVLALAYLDSRDVMDRLDAVCTPAGWQSEHYDAGHGRLGCRIGILLDGEWVWKSDGAGETKYEAEKGAFSGALKRAAVSWGIGRYLYGLGNTWVPCNTKQDGSFKNFKCDPWECVRNTEKDQFLGPQGKHELKENMRAVAAKLRGNTLVTTGDLDEVQTEFAETIEQAKRDAPGWHKAYEEQCRELLATLQAGPPSRERTAAE